LETGEVAKRGTSQVDLIAFCYAEILDGVSPVAGPVRIGIRASPASDDVVALAAFQEICRGIAGNVVIAFTAKRVFDDDAGDPGLVRKSVGNVAGNGKTTSRPVRRPRRAGRRRRFEIRKWPPPVGVSSSVAGFRLITASKFPS